MSVPGTEGNETVLGDSSLPLPSQRTTSFAPGSYPASSTGATFRGSPVNIELDPGGTRGRDYLS